MTYARAESICEHANKFQLELEGRGLARVSLSLGIAIFLEYGVTSIGILRAVDTALYRAKHEGRDQVVFADL